MRFHNHSRHTLPADKMLPREAFRTWPDKPSQRQRAYAKRFHTRKSRMYRKQQLHEALVA
jgi:hypothetical protein